MSTLQTYRPPRFHLILPLLLITFGAVLLLVQLGALPADGITRLLSLWPLLLVMLGIEIIAERTMPNAGGRIVAAVLIGLIALLGFAWAFAGSPFVFGGVRGDITGPAAASGNSSMVVNAGGARVHVTAAAAGAPLYSVSYDVRSVAPEVTNTGGAVTVTTRGQGWGMLQNRADRLDIALNPDVAWSVELNVGAAETQVDLAGLDIGSVRMNAGAGQVTLHLGQPSGTVPIDIRGGALSATIEVPTGAEARVVSTGAISSFQGPDGATSGWSTAGYAGAADRYEVTIEAAASSIRVVRVA